MVNPGFPCEVCAMTLHAYEEYNDTTGVTTITVFNTYSSTVTVTPPGETRPMTSDEIAVYQDAETSSAITSNTTTITSESHDAVDKLIRVIDRLNGLTKLSDFEINQNLAQTIRDLARDMKTIARQANRNARLASQRTDSSFTGVLSTPDGEG